MFVLETLDGFDVLIAAVVFWGFLGLMVIAFVGFGARRGREYDEIAETEIARRRENAGRHKQGVDT